MTVCVSETHPNVGSLEINKINFKKVKKVNFEIYLADRKATTCI